MTEHGESTILECGVDLLDLVEQVADDRRRCAGFARRTVSCARWLASRCAYRVGSRAA
jgi:hypothetical protein